MFAGSLVAIVTPMRADGAIDFEAWARLLELHAANGTDAIVVGGTTGESATLRDAELRELLLRACGQLHGRLTVIAGAGTSGTASTVERVTWLSELPIDGLLVVTPAYNRPSQEGLYRHFAAAAAAARKPLLLYNVPARTAVDMQPATVARLAHVTGIAGIKEAVAESARVRELVALCGGEFVVLSGDDATARDVRDAGRRAAGGCGARRRARCAPERPAPGAVRRGEPDPGEVAAGADGADRPGNTIAANASCARASRQPAGGGAQRRNICIRMKEHRA
jgi:4-hydroxy-tetrahydrodipicolinate synthase